MRQSVSLIWFVVVVENVMFEIESSSRISNYECGIICTVTNAVLLHHFLCVLFVQCYHLCS